MNSNVATCSEEQALYSDNGPMVVGLSFKLFVEANYRVLAKYLPDPFQFPPSQLV